MKNESSKANSIKQNKGVNGKNLNTKKTVDKKTTANKATTQKVVNEKKNDSTKNTGCGCLTVVVILVAFFLLFVSNNDTKKDDTKKEEAQKSTDAYGWTTDDYLDFSVALKAAADSYLSNYKMPHYSKWQFAKFDDYRIIAMTDELTFKDSHDKHTAICVFFITEDGTIAWNYFATDEKVYCDDGSCDEVFENIASLFQ